MLVRWIKTVKQRLDLLPEIVSRLDNLAQRAHDSMVREEAHARRLDQIEQHLGCVEHKIEHALGYLEHLQQKIYEMRHALIDLQQAAGRVELRQIEARPGRDLAASEFRVFSQFGEDGIIQFLLRHVTVPSKVFVEFGVEDYTESNTRFLLLNNNWSGLVIDGSEENIQKLRARRDYWLYDLNAVAAFVTRDNINQLLRDNGITGEIGLLSIDIDGNDYWVWQAIDVVNPATVLIEYNYRFGCDAAVTVPYDEGFDRARRIIHDLLRRLIESALPSGRAEGLLPVGCTSSGVNAFSFAAI